MKEKTLPLVWASSKSASAFCLFFNIFFFIIDIHLDSPLNLYLFYRSTQKKQVKSV